MDEFINILCYYWNIIYYIFIFVGEIRFILIFRKSNNLSETENAKNFVYMIIWMRVIKIYLLRSNE